MEMGDTKLGFSHLPLLRCNNNILFKMRKEVENDLYLSSQLCKSMFIGQFKGGDVVHGPCLSDKDRVASKVFHQQRIIYAIQYLHAVIL
jgi:hypothetical protein